MRFKTDFELGVNKEKMKELKDFEALSFTGKASKDDPTGIYEGDLDPVRRAPPQLAARRSSSRVAPARAPPHPRAAQRGKRHGNGVMKYRTGDLYEGTWENDCMHGQGIMVYSNGEKYRGQWVR